MRAPCVILATLLAGGVARAAPDPCAPAAVDPALGPRAVAIGNSPDVEPGVMVAAPGSSFPAVSQDGTTVVQLFADHVDFVGTPVETLVFFTKGGASEAFTVEGDTMTPPGAELVAANAKQVDLANARLAKTRWRALAVATPCPGDSDDAHSTVHLGGGLRIAYDVAHARLTARVGKTTRTLRDTFPPPGTTSEKDLSPTCGGVSGLAQAYGSRALGFVVLEPRVQLGGDSCMGSLGVDLSIVVRL